MAKPIVAKTRNPLIDEDEHQTISNVIGVCTFLEYTLETLINHGGNETAAYGATMVLACAGNALEHARQEVQPKAVRP